ncbi:hypothetical protein G9A89_018613 [Geosiphon pyriformis]|nr:hypothetical protein G9A89_018613 [Geosiphon pyriformis]
MKNNSNLDTMWEALKKTLMHAADVVFSKHWLSEYNCSRNRQSLKFFKLELLILRIVKAFSSGDLLESNWLIKVWSVVNNKKASKFARLVLNGADLLELLKYLSIVKKGYWKSKYYESRASEDAVIKKTINHHIKNFCFDKERMIKSILEHSFYKIILDHLVIDNELVIEPDKVKLKVDEIMEGWTRKWSMFSQMPNLWSHQYMLLNYVNDNAFSGVMKEIDMEELSLVVDNLPNEKAAELPEIPNKL